MFTERLDRLPHTLHAVSICPPASCRRPWQSLPESVRRRFAAAGRRAQEEPLAPLPLSLWQEFGRTGRRAGWEAAYFSRRRRLAALAAAEAVEYQGKLLPALADTIWAVCEESAWQLPAHNSYIRDTPQLPLPAAERPIIDLFAAETGALLAVTAALLGPELDAHAPGLTGRIRYEVERRILAPYRTEHFWWMGDGDEPMCNWTSWCTQNVLLAVFALPAAPEVQQAAVRQAAYSLDCFLKDYGPDGCCNEGAQYYRHAGLTLWGAASLLAQAAPEAFGDIFAQPKLRNIAEYILNVHADGDYYFNFGDCSPLAGACGVREFLFGQAVGSPALMALAAAQYRADPDPEHLQQSDGVGGINLWYWLLDAFHERELLDWTGPAPGAAAQPVWYPSVGLYLARSGPLAAAIKLGGNGDSHNHNDTGSVTVYKDGRPCLIDVGVESYTQKTFSPQRYEIWTMQSAWHNLPAFGGVQQLPGAEYAARDIRLLANGIEGDLAGAYPPIEGLGFYRRRFVLDGGALHLTDETDWSGTVELTLMSCEAPQPEGASRIRLGTLAALTLDGARETPQVQAVPVTDPRLRTAWPDTLYRITVRFAHRLHLTLK